MAERSASASRKHKWLSPPEMSPSKYLRSSESRRVSHSRERDTESPSPSQDRRVTLHPCESTPRRRLNISAAVRSTVRARSRQLHGTDPGPETPEEAPHKEATSSSEVRRPRPRLNSGPSLIFQKAFSDILGTPCRPRRSLGSAVRRSLEERKVEKKIHSDPEESPVICSTPKSYPTDKEAVRERKCKSEEVKKATSPKRTIASVIIKREVHVRQEAPRLVFLGEDSDKETHPTTDLTEKDPSIGSDFSDVEDMESLTRFSQDDVSLPLCCSFPEDTKLSTNYESPLSGYIELPTSSPVYRPPAEHNTWRQKEQDQSFVSEPSLLDSDCESPIKKGHSPFDSPSAQWIFGKTSRSIQKTLETLPSTSTDCKYQDGGFIDTHCHLDMLFSRLSHKSSFEDLREQYSSTFPQEFHGCITDYCDPRTLPRLPWQQVLNEDLVWGAFGCHPHFAQYYNNRQHEDMMMALRHPKAIAFGEMGLDYSHKCSTSVPDQISVFEKQLKLVVPLGKPLVIHCRGADEDLFKIMKKWLPRDYKIHRHCFTGKYEDIEPALKEFPNMAVGFTAVLTYPSAVEARDAVTKIPLDRLIVETDAPFFVPKQVPKRMCKFAHPGLAIHTIHEIARLRNIPVKSVMSKLRENTYRIYSV